MSRRDPMETIAKVKRIRERQAMAELARAEQEVAAAESEVAGARAVAAEVAHQVPTPLPSQLLVSLHLRGLATIENIRLAEEEWERAVQRRRDATRRVVQAAADRKSIEKLAQRREAEALALRRIVAQRTLDDLNLLRRGPDVAEGSA